MHPVDPNWHPTLTKPEMALENEETIPTETAYDW
jgi:hypothetical protein